MSQALYDLPEGWEWVTIADLINKKGLFTDGDWVESKDQDPDGEIRLIQLADIGVGVFRDKSDRFLTKDKALELKCSFLNEGDILFARMPDPIGRACLFPKISQTCVTVVDVSIIRPFNENVLSNWLVNVINSPSFHREVLSLQKGTTRKRISRTNLSSIKLPLPPLTEQSRIVEKLDAVLSRIDTAIDELQQSLALVDAFYKSSLKAKTNDLEGKWTRYSLNELGCFSGGGTPSKSRSDYWGGEILWITPKDMKSWKLSDSEMKITDIGLKESSAKLLPKNSVLIVARSGILQHTLPVAINTVEATVNQDIKVFIPSDKIVAEYVQYMLKGHEAFILSQLVKGGVTVESLKYSEFQEHPFPVPDLQAQVQIVGELDALNNKTTLLKTELTAKIGMFNQLKASVLDGAFRGGL
ncbi:MAG TPA: restriction endonuclease subunit S [Thiotrichales bacterium]|nr:restriction endonuclease subunit S [Thiotrichales bacterium]